jgi:hypothetical protein
MYFEYFCPRWFLLDVRVELFPREPVEVTDPLSCLQLSHFLRSDEDPSWIGSVGVVGAVSRLGLAIGGSFWVVTERLHGKGGG